MQVDAFKRNNNTGTFGCNVLLQAQVMLDILKQRSKPATLN